ncbi:MAG: DNA-directed RNA polymerase subunit omega [Firmicutes bacterium]|nr:DNA-directed RNA polymerase subunit omega [Bacillota bacterium]
MINPPIDKMIEKVGCKFALVTLVSKRAHEVVDRQPDSFFESGDTLITYVAKEVYEDKVESV